MSDKTKQQCEEILAQCRNEDGTFNLLKGLSMLIGIDIKELTWVAARITELTAKGVPPSEITAQLLEERKSASWEEV